MIWLGALLFGVGLATVVSVTRDANGLEYDNAKQAGKAFVAGYGVAGLGVLLILLAALS